MLLLQPQEGSTKSISSSSHCHTLGLSAVHGSGHSAFCCLRYKPENMVDEGLKETVVRYRQ
ncbi:hypothetical protein PILCRDRAFT_824974, partial [Piloderma croceum F 1598]